VPEAEDVNLPPVVRHSIVQEVPDTPKEDAPDAAKALALGGNPDARLQRDQIEGSHNFIGQRLRAACRLVRHQSLAASICRAA
jgi:hypothetical protein